MNKTKMVTPSLESDLVDWAYRRAALGPVQKAINEWKARRRKIGSVKGIAAKHGVNISTVRSLMLRMDLPKVDGSQRKKRSDY